MQQQGIRLTHTFFRRDVLEVAPDLPGKILVRTFPGGITARYIITETEAYRGVEDLACHASKGRTPRTDVMFHDGGLIYVYLIYGMYWMFNVVTGNEGEASAVLIRGIGDITGPGKVGKALQIDRSFYGEDLETSTRLWIEETHTGRAAYTTHPRVGINYAGEPWVSMPWRYRLI
jgi:DNA-3-methyladenine glycosylase